MVKRFPVFPFSFFPIKRFSTESKYRSGSVIIIYINIYIIIKDLNEFFTFLPQTFLNFEKRLIGKKENGKTGK